MAILAEDYFGTGGLKSVLDFNDHHVEGLGMVAIPFNWTYGFDIEGVLKQKLNSATFTIPVEDQGTSGSCGGQALRYYLEVLNALRTGTFTRFSAKYPYCQIFYPGGGTTIRDIGNIGSNKGDCHETDFPSYYDNGLPPSEIFMEDKTLLSQAKDTLAHLNEEFGYAHTGLDIDSVAQAIRDNNGIIIRINGQNNGTWLSAFPKAPSSAQWSHFLYGGKAEIINGEKKIGFLNSWGGSVGQAGWQWLGEDYFKNGVLESLVFYDKALYTYTPTSGQAVLSWFQKFLQWFWKYNTKQVIN